MTKKIIYAVSKGCYSDYSVVALFSKEADAKLFMERHPDAGYSGWNELEPYELDSGVEQIRKGHTHYMVQMREDGSTFNAPDTSVAYHMNDQSDKEFRNKSYEGGGRWFNWYGWAKDSDHAIKSANEHRAQLLALPSQSGQSL